MTARKKPSASRRGGAKRPRTKPPAATPRTHAPKPAPEPAPVEATVLPAGAHTPARTSPEAAFDALYARAATALLRQTELLTGDPLFSRRAVAHAFDLAWQRWPEVARDADPMGWVRAAAYDYALAPWQRWVPGGHRAEPRTAPGSLEAALVELPPAHRKAVLLHDGLGLGLLETAMEIEASTAATAGRIVRGREALVAAVPDLGAGNGAAGDGGEDVPARLGALLAEGLDREPPQKPARVRDASELGVRQRTVAAYALTALIAVATVLTLLFGPGTGTRPESGRPPGPEPSGPASGAQHGGAGAPPARDGARAVVL